MVFVSVQDIIDKKFVIKVEYESQGQLAKGGSKGKGKQKEQLDMIDIEDQEPLL